ncbi:MAG: TolC family protein [Bacteroidales bacterium]|nr:TolC family protein [Bacteroidales bacterium]
MVGLKHFSVFACLVLTTSLTTYAQTAEPQDTTTTIITLEEALQIALSENASVKVADKEITRTGYARKGSYASLYPDISASASFQRTLKKQKMYMDGIPGMEDGMEVGRWNTWNAGVSASMPLINAQLWESLKISDKDVELAVEKARDSRLQMVTQVKNAYFACLLAKEAYDVYTRVYENAVENLEQTQLKYNAQRASELDLARAKTNVASAVPNMYDAESNIILTLWQLKAVMGVDLEANIDVAGSLSDWAGHMLYDTGELASIDLDRNSTMRQLAIQADQLASSVKMQQFANIPSLALAFSYSFNAMENEWNFSEYKWSPYSYVGISLSIPIFAGGRRSMAIKQAKVQATELDIQRINTERQLKIAIRQYLNTMDTQIKSMSSAQSAVESAQKAYDIASKSYSVGRSTLTDLNVSQLALTQAQLTVSQAIYYFLVAKSNLEEVLGADFIDEQGNVQLNKTYGNE